MEIYDELMKWKVRVCNKCKSDDLDQIDYFEKDNEKGDRTPYATYQCRMDDCHHRFVDELDEFIIEEEYNY